MKGGKENKQAVLELTEVVISYVEVVVVIRARHVEIVIEAQPVHHVEVVGTGVELGVELGACLEIEILKANVEFSLDNRKARFGTEI